MSQIIWPRWHERYLCNLTIKEKTEVSIKEEALADGCDIDYRIIEIETRD